MNNFINSIIHWEKFYEILKYGDCPENFDYSVADIFNLDRLDDDSIDIDFYQDDEILNLCDKTKLSLVEFLSFRLKEYKSSDINVTQKGSCVQLDTANQLDHSTKILSPIDHPEQENFRFLIKGYDWLIFVQLICGHPSVFVFNVPDVGSFVYQNSDGSTSLPFDEPHIINDISILERLTLLLKEFLLKPCF